MCYLEVDVVSPCSTNRTCLQGKRLIFVTNNATKSRQGYTKKFNSLGLNVTKVLQPEAIGHFVHAWQKRAESQLQPWCAGGDLLVLLCCSSVPAVTQVQQRQEGASR